MNSIEAAERQNRLEGAALARKPIVIESVESSYERRPEIWHDVTRKQWNSYRWQWENRLLTAHELHKALSLSDEELLITAAQADGFPVAVTPHYAALVRAAEGLFCPIRRQCVPMPPELRHHRDLLQDPLGEARHAIAPCATRRYPDRAMLYMTHECAMRCRHCTRRARIARMEDISEDAIYGSVDAVVANPAIRDVLISGGDPLSIPNEILRDTMRTLRGCDHIDVIRLCTRMPCTLPQRFQDPELLAILTEFAPIYVNTQFNHPYEATIEAETAFRQLRKCGCILGNQSVLLRGVNDNSRILEPLYRWLLRNGCRPYYLFQCDVADGTQHFRTPISVGLEIMSELRGRLSGLGIPHYVIDLPDGNGKVDLCPERIESRHGDVITFKTWFGGTVEYHDVNYGVPDDGYADDIDTNTDHDEGAAPADRDKK